MINFNELKSGNLISIVYNFLDFKIKPGLIIHCSDALEEIKNDKILIYLNSKKDFRSEYYYFIGTIDGNTITTYRVNICIDTIINYNEK